MEQVFAQVDIKSVFAPAGTFTNFGSIVSVVVKNSFVLAGIISFILLIIGGLGVIMSAGSGDAKQMEQAKKSITGAVLGLIIVVTSVLIVQVIATLTGSDILKQMIGGK
jgi:hypothetical protein